jgi:long-chain acyl-CoA synthetase
VSGQEPAPADRIDLSDAFRGREILITGVTGFLGKVALVMLLDRYPEVGKVHVLVRPRAGGTASERFFGKVATAEPFRPLRQKHGDRFDAFLREKCHPLAGDVTDPLLGLKKEEVEALKGRLACVINSAGLVTFDPSLELAVSVNTEGAMNAAELCKETGATLVHISTCFVAGARRGPVFEDEPVLHSFPKQHDEDLKMEGAKFSVADELKDVAALVQRTRAQADDTALAASFRAAAIRRLESEGRDPNDEKALRLAVGRERKLWLSGRLIEAGMERAKAWGWPNTYTYSKALGEQAIAQSGCRYSLVRPAIVESAMAFPFPGWNEGFTTSAPIAFMALKGHRAFPAGERLVLDLIPVDMVAAGMLGVAGAACVGRARTVYHLASGDVNPFYVRRAVELCALYKRRYFKERAGETPKSFLEQWLDEWLEPYPVAGPIYQATSAPLVRAAAKGVRELIAKKGLPWGMPSLSALIQQADQKLESMDRQLAMIDITWSLFMPFVAGERFVFQCRHTRELWAQLSEADREKLVWAPERIDWRHYWLEVHMAGLEEWVFPGLEEENEKLRPEVPQSKDLLQLLNAAIDAYGHRTALRFFAGEENQEELARTRDDRTTYRELGLFSDRAGRRLLYEGIGAGDRVLLLSENRPEWAMVYFGALKAGAAVAPLDSGLSLAEVENCFKAASAKALLASPKVIDRLGAEALAKSGLTVLPLPELLRGPPGGAQLDKAGKKLPALRTQAAADDVASLLFTSGTTGKPKGVLLTHRNFASLSARIAGLFDLKVGEGLLSVLPLHHTFEFTCGLLVPLSMGAEITYLDELTAERLGEALEGGDIHALIGVPALWQLLHRRITQELSAKPAVVKAAVEAAMNLHAELRNRTSLNLGKLLFWPIHRKFGGSLRLLVSGGSALPDEVHEAFHQLGFDLTEGYGLTEAAPVLAVTLPENKRRSGTVGPPIPGVEIRIKDPDDGGVGEVIAKGPNIMSGYLDDMEATQKTLIDGWLHTGDLGKLSADGHLTLVGRKKDVILDSSGKNVYPDELEELYAVVKDDALLIKELCVVGLPDGKGHERVAALCVVRAPKEPREGEEAAEGESREALREKARAHFAKVSADLPFWKRIKILHFWDGELPKTATRKVKRPQVLAELLRLERAAEAGLKAAGDAAAPARGKEAWLFDLVAELAHKPKGSVNAGTRLVADLGFDSLLVAELSVAIDKAGYSAPEESRLASIGTAGELAAALGERKGDPAKAHTVDSDAARKSEEIAVPASVAAAGRAAISLAQRFLYEGIFDLELEGQANVPHHGSFLVAANHSSHLDVGLVKMALGEEGGKLASLAARDYFFDNPWKRAWFGNFTNLVPLDRRGSLKESLQTAVRTLELGYHLLIFPEGTRSPDGVMREFKPAIGYLSFAAGADILPVFLDGVHQAMPKGAFMPDPRENRKLKARVGPPLRFAALKRATAGMSRSAAHREVTRLVRLAVEALRDGTAAPEIPARPAVEARLAAPAAPAGEEG